MGKNNRERRKKKLAVQQATQKAKYTRRRGSEAKQSQIADRQADLTLASSSDEPRLQVFEYHHIVFESLAEEANSAVEGAALEPRAARRLYWSVDERVGVFSGEAAWAHLNGYLELIEAAMRSIIERHSRYYWIHLYRRTGLGLDPLLENKRDNRTLGLVRNIMEVAFARYGRMDEVVSDIALSSQVPIENVAGGLFIRALQRNRSAAEFGNLLNTLSAAFRDKPRWLITKFTVDDFVDIYRLEALAYEYWLTTARMRRIGKGGVLTVSSAGDPLSDGNRDDDLECRIRNYDNRIEQGGFQASSIGVAFFDVSTPNSLYAPLPSYNLAGDKWPDICSDEGAKEQTQLVTNFGWSLFSMNAFADAHAFAENAFRKARGFGFRSFCAYLSAIVILEFTWAQEKSDELRTAALLHLYQRAYVVNRPDSYPAVLAETAIGLMDQWMGVGNHQMQADAQSIHEFLTSTAEKRKGTGFWSLGPRHVFFRHEQGLVVDLQGIPIILRNAFFGVSYNQGAKGHLFEDEFRKYVASKHLCVLPDRVLRFGKLERETDVAVRCNDILFLCECRAMERPLDFELGRVRTLEARSAELKEKVEQVLSLAEFVKNSPRGSNYDFSWAKRIIPLVVSPFVEWIWASGDDLWLDESTPRVLSAGEAIVLMRREAERSTASE